MDDKINILSGLGAKLAAGDSKMEKWSCLEEWADLRGYMQANDSSTCHVGQQRRVTCMEVPKGAE